MHVLVVHGLGVDDEKKAEAFPSRTEKALRKAYRGAGFPDESLALAVGDFHEFLSEDVARRYDKRADFSDQRFSSRDRLWRCTCCTKNLTSNVMAKLVEKTPVPTRAVDAAMDREAPLVKDWLRRPGYRRAIADQIHSAVSIPPRVVIGHSMGTLVALDLIATWPYHQPPDLLITIGSPLALENIWQKLAPVHQHWIRTRTTDWVNLFDKRDLVTAARPLPAIRFPDVVNVRVRNVRQGHDDNPHGSRRYLSHRIVPTLLAGLESGTLSAGRIRPKHASKLPNVEKY